MTLPTEIIRFRGTPRKEANVLEWQTVSETDNAGFEVQKSENGIFWKRIGFVEGKGATSGVNSYQFQDADPFLGTNYYRLKQIDLDGVFDHSIVATVERHNAARRVEVFPNPSYGITNVRINNPSGYSTKIDISDNLGRRVWERQLTAEESTSIKEIEIKDSGIYILTVQIGNTVYNERILVTND